MTLAILAPGIKTVWFDGDFDADDGDRRVRNVVTDGSHRFNFYVPEDFASLVSIDILGYSVGAISAQSINLYSDYAAVGEASNQHSESDTSNTLTTTAGQIFEMDLSSVFSSLNAGDHCGVLIDHQTIGTTIRYLGIRLRYQ